MKDLIDIVKCGDKNAYIYKRIEDGILNKLPNASEKQLEMLENYGFQFYTSLNDKETLRSFIKSKLREDRLGKLLDESSSSK
ncbi:MAG: hypothetical protein SLAVMIC_00977 [uncultured marine phage]|uniref:Uncharacterized protein n=1 Tax=uncultured marine phage TaxID=707152 RepID=A0A8D9C9U7_9VIRU|nr:MAG: hypothetical protein SLAVMIC_00977 [uncultured marine phage]